MTIRRRRSRPPSAGASDGTFPAAAATLIAIGVVLAALDLTRPAVPLPRGRHGLARRTKRPAAQLRAHQNPYAWANAADIRALDAYPYLYPPPLAWIWGFGLNASLWVGLKIASLAALGLFAVRATSLPAARASCSRPRLSGWRSPSRRSSTT